MLERLLKRKRSQIEKLTNDPLTIEVGGYSDPKTKKTIELREPNLDTLGRDLSIKRVGIVGYLTANQGFIEKAVTNPSSLSVKDVVSFDSIPDAALEMLGDLVGEDKEYVLKEMHGKETVVLLEKYLELIGWDIIVKTFTQAWQSWNAMVTAATGKTEMPSAPPPPRSAGQ